MKITYEFADGTRSVVEVSDELGTTILASRREEESAERKHRRHCYSYDAIESEGEEYGESDFTEELFSDEAETSERVLDAFSHLSDVQKKRLQMLAAGLSEREIARREGKDIKTIWESIEGARKKFLRFF